MSLTDAQKKSPFRQTSTGLVIERSLGSGEEQDWAHWWDTGVLAKGLANEKYTHSLLRSAAEGFRFGSLGDEWLERLMPLVPPAYKESKVDWASPLARHHRGLEIFQRHGGNVFARLMNNYDRHPHLWASSFQEQVFRRHPAYPPIPDEVLEQRVNQLAKWVEERPLSPSVMALGMALSQVWRAVDHGVGGMLTERALDTLACRLIDLGADPSALGFNDRNSPWEWRHELLARPRELESLSVEKGLRLLSNLPADQKLHRSSEYMVEMVTRWDPKEEPIYKQWVRAVNPWWAEWQTFMGSPPRYESLIQAWWVTGQSRSGRQPETALPWLRLLRQEAMNNPPDYHWFEALNHALEKHWSVLPNDAASQQAEDHGRALAAVAGELVEIALLANNTHSKSGFQFALDTLAMHAQQGAVVIDAFVRALDVPSVQGQRVLSWLFSPIESHGLSKPEWHPTRWWGRYLSNPANVEQLMALGIHCQPEVANVTWVTLMDPHASSDTPGVELSQAQKKLLEQAPLTSQRAIDQSWRLALKVPAKLVQAVEIGIPLQYDRWFPFMPCFTGSFNRVSTDDGRNLEGLADALVGRGWRLSGGDQGNVLSLFQPTRGFPLSLLENLLEKGATMEGIEAQCPADDEAGMAFNRALHLWKAEQASAFLDQSLDQVAPSGRKVRM